MSSLRLSGAGPGAEQGWGELTETTVTLRESVENGRTLSCTWTGSSSESASEKLRPSQEGGPKGSDEVGTPQGFLGAAWN